MLAATISFVEFWHVDSHTFGHSSTDPYRKSAVNASFAFKCSDGALLAVHLSSDPKFFQAFSEAVGAPELPTDPRYSTQSARIDNYESLRADLGRLISEHSRGYWLERFADYDFPYAPILSINEVAADPQVRHMDLVYDIPRPAGPNTYAIKRPIRINGETGYEDSSAPPLLGEHSAEVFRGLGYSDQDIARLHESGVLQSPDPAAG